MHKKFKSNLTVQDRRRRRRCRVRHHNTQYTQVCGNRFDDLFTGGLLSSCYLFYLVLATNSSHS